MFPGLEQLACQDLAVPMSVMQHVVHVESSNNPYAIGVVGGALVRQPANADEALATAKMLEEKGYNFSLGLGQVNRYNLSKYGLDSYEKAFQQCPNLQAASKILAECYSRSANDWGKSFSCYYSGNFVTGYRHGYVQKVFASIERERSAGQVAPIGLVGGGQVQPTRRTAVASRAPATPPVVAGKPASLVAQRTLVAMGDGPRSPAADPARAYVVYPSQGAMVRGSLIRSADATLARIISGPQAPADAAQPEGFGGPPSSAEMQQQLQQIQRTQQQQQLALMQRQAASASDASGPREGSEGDGPVMLHAWGDRSSAGGSQEPSPPPPPARAQDDTGGDAAFVF